MNTATPPAGPGALHICIATGQNAANLIPLLQYDARDIWILQTQTMRESAGHLALALKRDERSIERLPFDDDSPRRLEQEAERIAMKADGRHVVLHATGGTKLMVLALREGLRLVEAGSGRLDILYADTKRQQIDWLGGTSRTEPMADVLDLQTLLLVQGYRIEGDSRHPVAQQRAEARAKMTRWLGDNASKLGRALSALATLANRACTADAPERDLTQLLQYSPGGKLAELLRLAAEEGLATWDGHEAVTFKSRDSAAYFAGAWIEEFVLTKLTGNLRPGRFSSNLQVVSGEHGVPNEIDAMVVHNNRALLIECKTGRQDRAQGALYKLAQLRDRLGGSMASALYLSAQPLDDDSQRRADEYRITTLCGAEIGNFVKALKAWKDQR